MLVNERGAGHGREAPNVNLFGDEFLAAVKMSDLFGDEYLDVVEERKPVSLWELPGSTARVKPW